MQPLTYKWLATTTQLAPFTADTLLAPLKDSAENLYASKNEFDDIGEVTLETITLSAVSNLLISEAEVPLNAEDNDSGSSSNKTEESSPKSSSEIEVPEESSAMGLGMSVFLSSAALSLWTCMYLAL